MVFKDDKKKRKKRGEGEEKKRIRGRKMRESMLRWYGHVEKVQIMRMEEIFYVEILEGKRDRNVGDESGEKILY